jgi:hypothetical protein
MVDAARSTGASWKEASEGAGFGVAAEQLDVAVGEAGAKLWPEKS